MPMTLLNHVGVTVPDIDAAFAWYRDVLGLYPHRPPEEVVDDYVEKTDRNVTRETLDIATERGITVEEIIRTIHAHPTMSEALAEAAHAVHGAAIHS